MSVATLQQIGQDLSAWVALVQRGERVAITQAGRVVAQLVPPDAQNENTPPPQPPAWPDFAARQRAIFGDRMVFASAAESQAFWDEERGDRL